MGSCRKQILSALERTPSSSGCPHVWRASGLGSVTMRRMAVGEFDLIAKYFARPVRHAVLGGGDDCALLQPTPGMQWAVSTDALVEGRHFLSTVPPDALGHKSLAVNLSDRPPA